MSKGFLPYRVILAGSTHLVWLPDKSVQTAGTGTKVGQIKQRRIVAYRGDHCAYLECYAP